MDQQDVYLVIQKVVKNHRNKAFGYFTSDDIENEAWIIAIEKLPEFSIDKARCKDPLKALEHWLNTIISNRLSNLYRDKYVVPQKLNSSKSNNIINPSSLENFDKSCEILDLDSLAHLELWDYIIDNISIYDFEVLESILSGEKISSYYKTKLLNRLTKLMEEYNGRG